MKRTALVRAALCTAASFSAFGCLTGVPEEELPDESIAFTYRTEEEARRRAEDIKEQAERAGEGDLRGRRAGYRGRRNDLVATSEDVRGFFERAFGATQGGAGQHLGRLSLFDPRSGEVFPVVAARRGSIALAWSRDHSRLLFAQPGQGDYQIHEFDLRSETVRPITHGPFAHTQGCYGADGRIVVAVVDHRAPQVQSHIAISGPGGRRPFRKLTEGPADHTPACAPDGSMIVFVQEPDPPRAQLSVVETRPGAAPRPLSAGRHPSFSPEGEWIAFSAPFRRELRVWRIRPDGTGRAPIGRGRNSEARPSFSPDGRLVVYVTAEDPPRRRLYVRRFDGSGDRILFSGGDGEYPVW